MVYKYYYMLPHSWNISMEEYMEAYNSLMSYNKIIGENIESMRDENNIVRGVRRVHNTNVDKQTVITARNLITYYIYLQRKKRREQERLKKKQERRVVKEYFENILRNQRKRFKSSNTRTPIKSEF